MFGFNKTTAANNGKSSIMSAIKSQFIPAKCESDDIAMVMSLSGAGSSLAVKNKNGEYASYDTASATIITHGLSPKFMVGKYCFLVPTPANQITIGDTVLHNDFLTQVVKIQTNGNIQVINFARGTRSTIIPTVVDGLGFNTIQKVICMFDPKTQGMNPMMMLLMGDKEDASMEEMLPLLMMSGGLNGQTGQLNPMMAMMMFGKDKNDSGESFGIKDLMLMQAMSGTNGQAAGGMNPMMLMLMNDNGEGGSDMKNLMLMQMLGGGNMFGQQGVANNATTAQSANPFGQMNPMMMMAMMGDGGMDMKSLMLMQAMGGGNMFGQQPVAPVQPATEQ